MSKINGKKFILFDLDGTIIDSYPSITSCFLSASKEYTDREFTSDELASIIGPPLRDSYMRLLNVDAFTAWDLVIKFREYYNAGGLFNCKVYEGIEDLLISLIEAGLIPIVATSKPEEQAIRILMHFGFDKYFKLIAGDDQECTRAVKKDVITYCLKKLDSPSYNEVVMIGDRKYDMTGARELGITSIGVTWGYGSKKELEDSCADYLVSSAKELKELLI